VKLRVALLTSSTGHWVWCSVDDSKSSSGTSGKSGDEDELQRDIQVESPASAHVVLLRSGSGFR